jgi:hypothetical protein
MINERDQAYITATPKNAAKKWKKLLMWTDVEYNSV